MKRSLLALPLLAAAALTACGPTSQGHQIGAQPPASSAASQAPLPSPAPPSNGASDEVYAAAAAGELAPATRTAKSLVYVPDSGGDGFDIIDQKTMKLVKHRPSGATPRHVVAGWDLTTLYVTNQQAGTITAIDPRSGATGSSVPASDAYDLSFTPDGRYAVVIAKDRETLDFLDPHTFTLLRSVTLDCPGLESVDYTADDRYLVASCEFGGRLARLDLTTMQPAGTLTVGGMPEQVRLDPAGQVFYVADLSAGGVHEIDAASFRQIGFLSTGRGTHGVIVSRDGRSLYVTNRTSGTVTVINADTRKISATWHLKGSPDLGAVSADGSVLWLSDTYGNAVFAVSTANGQVLKRIPVGSRPLGICVWPQPGRYSLGAVTR